MNTGITLAILNLLGAIPVAKEALNTISKSFDINCFKILRIFIGRLEGPVALPSFRAVIIDSISADVVGDR